MWIPSMLLYFNSDIGKTSFLMLQTTEDHWVVWLQLTRKFLFNLDLYPDIRTHLVVAIFYS